MCQLRRRVSDALYNLRMATGGGDVQRRPSLAVGLVDAGVLIQKEGHHIHVAIYAGLWGEKKRSWGAATQRHFALGCLKTPKTGKKNTQNNKDVNKLAALRHLYKQPPYKADTRAD